MSDASRIEWTDATWNPITGCSPVSPGCDNCYAEIFARRLRAIGQRKYARGFRLTLHPECLEEPDRWRRPRRVFVCSMGDLFHPEVPISFLERVFATMERNDQHVYQILTKRAERLPQLASELSWPPNVWLGVSIEDDPRLWRLIGLREVPAAVRFVSFEPLLEELPRLFTGISARMAGVKESELADPLGILDWIIVGGESGRRARPMLEAWATRIRDAAVERGIPFFFKQHSEFQRARDRVLEGRLWNEFPAWTARGAHDESRAAA